jgi:hypothetical protein
VVQALLDLGGGRCQLPGADSALGLELLGQSTVHHYLLISTEI